MKTTQPTHQIEHTPIPIPNPIDPIHPTNSINPIAQFLDTLDSISHLVQFPKPLPTLGEIRKLIDHALAQLDDDRCQFDTTAPDFTQRCQSYQANRALLFGKIQQLNQSYREATRLGLPTDPFQIQPPANASPGIARQSGPDLQPGETTSSSTEAHSSTAPAPAESESEISNLKSPIPTGANSTNKEIAPAEPANSTQPTPLQPLASADDPAKIRRASDELRRTASDDPTNIRRTSGEDPSRPAEKTLLPALSQPPPASPQRFPLASRSTFPPGRSLRHQSH